MNKFPRFSNIELKHKNMLNGYLSNKPPYSDFNFLNLLIWNKNFCNQFSILNDNLVIKIKDYFSDTQIYSVLGKKKIPETIQSLLSITPVISMVPEYTLNYLRLTDSTLSILEDRDNYDYIVNLTDLINLRGSGFKRLRSNIYRFSKQYQSATYRELNLQNPVDINEIIRLNRRWGRSKNISSSDIENDSNAINNLIKYAPNFNLLNVGLFINNKLVGYTINELLEQSFVMGHFGRTDPLYKCSFFIEYITAHFLKAKGYEFINHEGDAGLEGLRVAKLCYRPSYLKKYIISSL